MGRVERERIEERTCDGCGKQVKFKVLRVQRGEDVYLHMHERHDAGCGRVCYESAGVTMRDVVVGNAHHPRRCECLKVGRGYQ